MARRGDSQARRSRRARVEELESRILLSAELPSALLAETLAHPEDAHEISEPLFSPEPVTHVAEQHASRHELVFVDADLEDRETLVADLLGQGSDQRIVEVVLLDGTRDGLSQITETLARYSADLDAVHVVSHGTSRGIQLGGTWLDQTLLDHEADLVAGWRDALSQDADLLLYGCNLAASSEGKALIEQLAGLTGADVAASTDLTGSTALGGDWDLEHRTGSIESFVIFTARAQQGYGAVLGGTAIWAESGLPTPQTSDFDGTSFGPESNTAAVGEWRVLAGAEAPTRDEKIVLGTDSGGALSGQIWDGSAWNSLPGVVAGLNVEEWSFDVAYSSQSGDALLVWTSATGTEISFATWDGVVLSTPASISAPMGSASIHIELAADPNSDEIMLVGNVGGGGGFAMVWNGTSFVDGRLFPDSGSSYVTDIDVVYEGQSGNAMLVYGNGNDIHYETYDGTTWSAGDLSDPTGPSSKARWTELAADPNSDRIAMVVATDFNTAWLSVWDGNAWQPSVLASNNTFHSDRQNIAVAFESNSGEAIAAYTRFGEDNVRYQRWTAAGGWSGELAGPALSTHPDSLTLDPDPNSDAIMLSVVEQGRAVEFLVWDGDTFGTPTTLEVDAGTNRGQPFLFLWDQGVSANAAPIADASAGAPHVISEGGTLDLDGSASSDPDGSIVSWEWDVGNDGSFEKSGVTASYDWSELNAAGLIDDGTVDVALRVTDDGGATNTQVFSLTVGNTAATITATGASSVEAGALYTLNLSATDPGDDTIVGWTINWGDGAIETVAGNPPSVTHVYTQAGFTRNITVSARDEDGSWTNSDLIVGNYRNNSDDIFVYDGTTGLFSSTFDPAGQNLDRPYYAVVGPDGNYYAAASDTNKIVRFDPSGTYLDDFVTAGLGGLFGPGGMAFGPDGSLFVASFYRDEILRYDASGSFTGVFASGGGLDGPAGLAFGPDGDLYMASWNNGRLLVVDGANGGTPSTLAAGLGNPEQMVFDDAGLLYFTTGSGDDVKVWDGVSATTYFSDPLLDFATGLAFGPDGALYVASYNNDRVFRYDGSTTQTFVLAGAGGLDQPEYLSFTPAQQVLVIATAQPPSVTSTVTDEDVQSTSGLVLDRNAANGAEVTHFKITSITNGTLYQNDGVTVINDGDFITFDEGNAGLRFTPAPDYSGPASFDVEASTTGDDTSLSGVTTASITVNPANDAPVLTPGAPALTPITEDDTGNAGDLVSSLLASSITDIDPSAVEGIAITGLSGANGVWEYDSGSGFTAVGPVSETSALLLRATDRIRFVPDARNGGIASFDFRAWDQTTGVAGGLVDASLPGGTSAFSFASDTASIVVTDVNDAPVLSTTPTPLLDDVTANAGPPTGAVGTLVSSLIDFPGGGGLDNVTDVDTGAVTGIAVMKLDSTNGTWHYSLDDGATWLLIPDVNANAALLLAAEPGVRLYFEPMPGFSGTIVDAIEFRAWDGTSGTSGGLGDTTPEGGQTAFSVGGDFADITVLSPASSAPSGSDVTIVTDEDVPYVFGAADFGFSDPDGDLLQGVVIETVPALGTLRNGASLLTGGEIISEADITAGNLVYTPIADASGAPYVSFSFRVQDDSGVVGFDTDSTPNTITFDVNPRNDAPVLTPSAPSLPTIDEDALSNGGELVANLLGISVTDVDSPAVEGIAITGLNASNGVWQYSTDGGSVWSTVGAVSDANALLLRDTDRVRFVPDGRNGETASFDFRAWDQTTGVAGGFGDASSPGGVSAFSLAIDTATLLVSDVNDAPVLDNTGTLMLVDVAESDPSPAGDTVASILASAGGDPISDIDIGAVEGIAVTSVDDSNGTWQYSTDGGTIWTDFGPVTDASAVVLDTTARVRFVPDVGFVGPAGDMAFRAWDRSTAANGQTGVDASTNGLTTAFSTEVETASVNVTALNAAPVLTPSAPSLAAIDEDETGNPGDVIATLVGGSIADANVGALQGLAITSLNSGNGTWQYSLDGGISWNTVGAVSDSSALLLRATDRVRFVPDTVHADTASFDFRAWDQTTGTAGARVDASLTGAATAFSAASDTASISVSALNDAPTLTGAASLVGGVGGQTNPPDASISSLVGGFFSDVDPGAQMSGVAVVGNSAAPTEGVWQYSSDGGANWFAIGAVGDDASALSLSATTRIRFLPDATFSGTPTALAMRGIDDSYAGGFSSTAGGAEARVNLDASANGGTSPVSATTSTVSTTALALLLDVEPVDTGAPEPAPIGGVSPEVAPALPDPEPAAPNAELPIVDLIPDFAGGGSTPAFDPGQPIAGTGRPELVLANDTDLAPEIRETREQRLDPAGTRTALDVLRDIYTGNSSIGGDVLANLIFGAERGDFMRELDVAQKDVQLLLSLETRMVSSAIAVTSGLSVGYVIWLTRGGLLIASLLSSMPAWRLIDPIPVLAHLGLPDEDEDEESLDSLVSQGSAEEPTRADPDDHATRSLK